MADETFDKDSIYESTVDALGLTLDGSADAFKTEVLGHINSSLGILTQVGCGRDIYVSDNTTTWSDFFGVSGSKGMAKQFVFQRTKLLFDPPTASTQKAMIDSNNELLWRINLNEGGEDLSSVISPITNLQDSEPDD